MRQIKLKMAVLSVTAILLTFFSQASLAYYTTIGRATNVVTTGDIRFIIHETTDQGTSFPQEGVYVMPGDVVSKQVTVESDCQHPFYLRVKIVCGVNEETLPDAECFRLNINEEYWQPVDGWYYYKDVVRPGESTPYIFSQVEIVGQQVDNAYLGKTLTLSVAAQAVQSENNPITGTNTFEASGWPEEGSSS